MFPAVYVYRRPGLTLDLTGEQAHLPPTAVVPGPALDRLSADPDNLLDPGRLR